MSLATVDRGGAGPLVEALCRLAFAGEVSRVEVGRAVRPRWVRLGEIDGDVVDLLLADVAENCPGDRSYAGASAGHPDATVVADLAELHRALASALVTAARPWFATVRAPFGLRGMWGQLVDDRHHHHARRPQRHRGPHPDRPGRG